MYGTDKIIYNSCKTRDQQLFLILFSINLFIDNSFCALTHASFH